MVRVSEGGGLGLIYGAGGGWRKKERRGEGKETRGDKTQENGLLNAHWSRVSESEHHH